MDAKLIWQTLGDALSKYNNSLIAKLLPLSLIRGRLGNHHGDQRALKKTLAPLGNLVHAAWEPCSVESLLTHRLFFPFVYWYSG
jgi:hypothetical protein